MRRGKAIAVALAVAGVAGLVCWKLADLASAGAPAAPPPAAVPVNAASVKIANVAALGTVQSIDPVNLMPQVNGRIVAIYFNQGIR